MFLLLDEQFEKWLCNGKNTIKLAVMHAPLYNMNILLVFVKSFLYKKYMPLSLRFIFLLRFSTISSLNFRKHLGTREQPVEINFTPFKSTMHLKPENYQAWKRNQICIPSQLKALFFLTFLEIRGIS